MSMGEASAFGVSSPGSFLEKDVRWQLLFGVAVTLPSLHPLLVVNNFLHSIYRSDPNVFRQYILDIPLHGFRVWIPIELK